MARKLIIFAKNPDLPVKTRLAASIGKELARQIYLHCVEHLLQTFPEAVWYIKGQEEFFTSKGAKTKQQIEGGLGDKMLAALEQELETHDKVLLIGSDLPEISTEDIEEAYAVLEEKDIVLGPSIDGGYYLVGMKKPYNIFSLEAFSHENVLQQTLKLVEEQKLTYGLIDKKRDIDTEEDLQVYRVKGFFKELFQ